MIEKITRAVDEKRLLDTAVSLIELPSPTLSAGAVADRLAEILVAEGFAVERPEADWPEAPAVVARLESGEPGRVLQFDGHLDTVHLPFVAPRIENGILYGSGSSDMKGGIAAFVEALRVLRDTDAIQRGGVMITAHDHHEAPWGDRRQLLALIREGYIGDGVLLPEYLGDVLPVAGRGMAVFSIEIERDGEPVHEVLRPAGLPDVVGVGAELIQRLKALCERLSAKIAPHVGSDSVFVGRMESGEIYNQSPVKCRIEGTRRWVAAGSEPKAKRELEELLAALAVESGTRVNLVDWVVPGDAFTVDEQSPLFAAFQGAHEAVTGNVLKVGAKPFIDDGNGFMNVGGVQALTHGPCATGAHTLDEEVPVAELLRVAKVYALTAFDFCQGGA
ncbi:MAG: M20/M25/M40 family metallo-hydrolase [Gemmatimonadetes bacterium]|jgi:acetylornithine deacetylase/succinyl-diaminopimelate desuccinylase-like protein|nr:M20/M25/M40 family metallo-hydrolase [Gemmatimonadota bacterium]MBT5804243.1 M20/M25/M40 family metallo-hydrolase [Gemmatimonadota bacterium]MBT6620369.1 M20/M25/M40 family metallo-hydrolase [Gemmatimonadota bacterium]MBT6904499.1 M20/M25/M40 family metallo-hydrolase [Gemmatimonadota bacterium]MBT7584473.1 M20/M25/M40 family metallo-hydrolase [Gemmatimonadota bacterium]|tara:strand:- start:3081 stop:4250 length:1170 start_codon:yes stop_codon:yes gene_type:complete